MRWIKFGTIAMILLLAVYAISTNWVEESETFTVQKQINYPVERVYPQFSNLQHFTRWNTYFSDNKDLSFSFFSPYEGQGSSMRYQDRKNNDVFGEFFLRYANPNHTLRYQLYRGYEEKPVLIDLKFKAQGNSTSVTWAVHIPQQTWLKRSLEFLSEEDVVGNIDRSMKALHAMLGNKVQKEQQRENLKFDSVMVEQREGQLLLGVNVTTKNGRDMLFRNIVLNHNKTLNFIQMDLAKKEDEFGEPVLITTAHNYKDKEVSYFYGFPISKRVGISDNNFNFRTVNPSRNYVIYYQGPYSGRAKAIQQLLAKARKDTLRTGELHQTFLENPTEERHTLIKFSLPVFR